MHISQETLPAQYGCSHNLDASKGCNAASISNAMSRSSISKQYDIFTDRAGKVSRAIDLCLDPTCFVVQPSKIHSTCDVNDIHQKVMMRDDATTVVIINLSTPRPAPPEDVIFMRRIMAFHRSIFLVVMMLVVLDGVGGLLLQKTATTRRQQQKTRPTTAKVTAMRMRMSDANRNNKNGLFPNSMPVTQADVDTFVRQTGQVNPSKAAIGVPAACQCRHGFPQAFALDPLPNPQNKNGGTTHTARLNSGLLKLTCPLLVRAVDQLEDEKFIPTWNEQQLQLGSSQTSNHNDNEWQLHCQTAHARHATVRQELLSGNDQKAIVEEKLGPRGAMAFYQSGVAGTSLGSHTTDLKCLHAWLADSLFFDGEDNGVGPIGTAIRQEFHDRGIDPTGTLTCAALCNPNSLTTADPPKPRNKQRLRTSKETLRRKRRKHEQNDPKEIL
eukprot:scaffold72587_cov48-Attheya_sp.AAC.1